MKLEEVLPAFRAGKRVQYFISEGLDDEDSWDDLALDTAFLFGMLLDKSFRIVDDSEEYLQRKINMCTNEIRLAYLSQEKEKLPGLQEELINLWERMNAISCQKNQ